MKGRPQLCLLVWLGGTLLALVARGPVMPLLLIDGPIPGERLFWPSLVYLPATLLLLAELRPWLAIKRRRCAGMGDTTCPLQLP
jgi:hypothetical protein